MTQTQTQMQAMRHRYRTLIIKQTRMIRVQWLVILCLTVMLVISICAEPSAKAAVNSDTPGVSMATMDALEAKDLVPVYIPAPGPITPAETTAPTEAAAPTEASTEVAASTETAAPTEAPTETAAPTEAPESTEPTPSQICLGEFKLTAYCTCKSCCGKGPDDPAYGLTASGAYATADHTIAVDPSIIPLGTEVVINGHTYIAEDTGGAINDKVIDIYFDDHQEALIFGVQYADVYINQY